MIYYEDKAFKVYWDEEIGAVVLMRKSAPYVSGEDIRTPSLKLLELAEQRKAKKYLYDGREAKVANLEDQEWLAKVFLPGFHALKIKHSALIVPKSTLGKISLENMQRATESENSSNRRYFNDLEEARSWLRSLTV